MPDFQESRGCQEMGKKHEQGEITTRDPHAFSSSTALVITVLVDNFIHADKYLGIMVMM